MFKDEISKCLQKKEGWQKDGSTLDLSKVNLEQRYLRGLSI